MLHADLPTKIYLIRVLYSVNSFDSCSYKPIFILTASQPSTSMALESPKSVRDELTEDSTLSDTEGVVIHMVVPLVVPPILLVSSAYSLKG